MRDPRDQDCFGLPAASRSTLAAEQGAAQSTIPGSQVWRWPTSQNDEVSAPGYPKQQALDK
jgi:hypothetical protein